MIVALAAYYILENNCSTCANLLVYAESRWPSGTTRLLSTQRTQSGSTLGLSGSWRLISQVSGQNKELSVESRIQDQYIKRIIVLYYLFTLIIVKTSTINRLAQIAHLFDVLFNRLNAPFCCLL